MKIGCPTLSSFAYRPKWLLSPEILQQEAKSYFTADLTAPIRSEEGQLETVRF